MNLYECGNVPAKDDVVKVGSNPNRVFRANSQHVGEIASVALLDEESGMITLRGVQGWFEPGGFKLVARNGVGAMEGDLLEVAAKIYANAKDDYPLNSPESTSIRMAAIVKAKYLLADLAVMGPAKPMTPDEAGI